MVGKKRAKSTRGYPTYAVGDRVFYMEGGPEDVGTITGVVRRGNHYDYRVRWDNGDPKDEYAAGQLRPVE